MKREREKSAKCHRGQKTLTATEARKSQGNSNKSATTFAYNTVATFFMRAQATDPNSSLSPFLPCPCCQPRLSKVEPFKDSALSFIRQTYDYTYVHMLVISGRETKEQIPVTKKRANIQFSYVFFTAGIKCVI